MGRGWAIALGLFALVWAANAGLVLTGTEDGAAYPVSAFPMFSGQPPKAVTRYWVEVAPADGGANQSLPLVRAMHPTEDVVPSYANNLARYVVLSTQNGCPGLQVRADDACSGPPAVPPTVVAAWSAAAQARLGLDAPPRSVALVRETVPLDGGEPTRTVVAEAVP